MDDHHASAAVLCDAQTWKSTHADASINWGNLSAGSPASQVRDHALTLLKTSSPSKVSHLLGHPVWTQWRSKTGRNNFLDMAVQASPDPWIFWFIEQGLTSPKLFEYLCRRSNTTWLETIGKLWNRFQQEDPKVLNKLVLESIANLRWSGIVWAMEQEPDATLAVLKVHQENINMALAKALRFDGPKIKTNPLNVLEQLWSWTGVPGIAVLRKMWAQARAKPMIDRIEQEWNPSHPDWSTDDLRWYVHTCYQKKKMGQLQQKVDEGWVFAEACWEGLLDARAPRLNHAQWVALQEQCVLRAATMEIQPAPPKKRMM